MYANIATRTPPLADGLSANAVVRQTLEQILAGNKTYGMPGYKVFDWGGGEDAYKEWSADTARLC